MSKIIDGKAVSAAVRADVKKEAERLTSLGHQPGLAVIIVGNDPASEVYVRNKHRACEENSIKSFQYALPENTSEEELLALIDKLNGDAEVDGILCQMPVPAHLDDKKIINAIAPEKDVDAFHPVNTGKIMTGDYGFLPCTPAGVMEMLKFYDISVEGKNCVVIGRSNIVGKPMAALLINAGATVTVCNSKTRNLQEITSEADILVAAVGRPKLVTADMVKEGAVVIDVGINRLPDKKLCGDVDFENVSEKASYITPVPGGVGPMTITMLLKNTVTAARRAMEASE